jgi:hypothetical protein
MPTGWFNSPRLTYSAASICKLSSPAAAVMGKVSYTLLTVLNAGRAGAGGTLWRFRQRKT